MTVEGLGYKVASGSTIAACIIVDAIVAETAQQLVARSVEPLVYPAITWLQMKRRKLHSLPMRNGC